MKLKRIGEFLVGAGAINEAQLQEALKVQKSTGNRLGDVLLELGYITQKQLNDILEEQLDIAQVEFKDIDVKPEIINLIPENIMYRHRVFPVKAEGEFLQVAMVDPLNVVAIDDLCLVSGYDIKPLIINEHDLEKVFDKYLGIGAMDSQTLQELAVTQKQETDIAVAAVAAETDDAPIIKIVNSLLQQAVKLKASDVHIEPMEEKIKIRFRVDGLLRDITSLPSSAHPLITSRIKIMSEINISEKRLPQDGRCNYNIGNKTIDLRVSSLPTVYGEKIVMRILDKSSMMTTLEKLGMGSVALEAYEDLIRRPFGMILVTGPTGSGKTTTLYATLNYLNNSEYNIVTTEDPVEYLLPGINQTGVNVKAGLTFAAALRAILRQDPDIIMVGEIRDIETAQVAVQAATTGHLVFSTLHTNNASGTISRLIDMGIEPFLIASALNGVVAQRLLRKICPTCKTAYKLAPDAPERAVLEIEPQKELTLYRGNGCSDCDNTGYQGRVAVVEVLVVNQEIHKLIMQRATAMHIFNKAVETGMQTLRQDGIAKVLQGLTTYEELFRVTSS